MLKTAPMKTFEIQFKSVEVRTTPALFQTGPASLSETTFWLFQIVFGCFRFFQKDANRGQTGQTGPASLSETTFWLFQIVFGCFRFSKKTPALFQTGRKSLSETTAENV